MLRTFMPEFIFDISGIFAHVFPRAGVNLNDLNEAKGWTFFTKQFGGSAETTIAIVGELLMFTFEDEEVIAMGGYLGGSMEQRIGLLIFFCLSHKSVRKSSAFCERGLSFL